MLWIVGGLVFLLVALALNLIFGPVVGFAAALGALYSLQFIDNLFIEVPLILGAMLLIVFSVFDFLDLIAKRWR